MPETRLSLSVGALEVRLGGQGQPPPHKRRRLDLQPFQCPCCTQQCLRPVKLVAHLQNCCADLVSPQVRPCTAARSRVPPALGPSTRSHMQEVAQLPLDDELAVRSWLAGLQEKESANRRRAVRAFWLVRDWPFAGADARTRAQLAIVFTTTDEAGARVRRPVSDVAHALRLPQKRCAPCGPRRPGVLRLLTWWVCRADMLFRQAQKSIELPADDVPVEVGAAPAGLRWSILA